MGRGFVHTRRIGVILCRLREWELSGLHLTLIKIYMIYLSFNFISPLPILHSLPPLVLQCQYNAFFRIMAYLLTCCLDSEGGQFYGIRLRVLDNMRELIVDMMIYLDCWQLLQSYQIVIMNSQNNYDFLFKYIMVGDTSVGKSCLLGRYVEGSFKSEHEPTLGVEFASKVVEMEAQIIKTQIWDTAGQQSFKAITRSYYKGSIAAFLVFDITSRQSFESLHKWLYQVKNHSHDKIEIILLGNKIDLKANRVVAFEEADTFARNNGFPYLEVSAKSGERVDESFLRISQKILRRIKENDLNPDGDSSMGIRRGKKKLISQGTTNTLNLNNQSNSNKSSCCK